MKQGKKWGGGGGGVYYQTKFGGKLPIANLNENNKI